MAVYAIGDIQGCFAELEALLLKIKFDAGNDVLWFAGDLINRGPESLQVLRFVKSLGDAAVTVLGNHDLHFLAIAAGCANVKSTDTLDTLLYAPDAEELIDWLRVQPLLHHDEALDFTMVHAGLPPQWDLPKAVSCAQELEQVLRADDYREFFKHMYGNKPDVWSEDLSGWGRLRYIVNCFSRLRYCDADGKLKLKESGAPGTQGHGYIPWFEMPGRLSVNDRIIFGHWSTLRLYDIADKKLFPIDTGCVWGDELTAIKLQAEPEVFSVNCPGSCKPA